MIIAASIIYPTAAGITLIEKSPTSVLIFVQNQHCVTIFEGHTNTTQTFDIEQSFTSNRNVSIENNKGKDFISSNVKIRFEEKKFKELANKDNVYIEETKDIEIMKLKSEFPGKCFFCASAASNLCRRTLFSLGSHSDNVCDADQCPSTKCSCQPWGEWTPCLKKCGGGERFRSRTCEKDKKCVESGLLDQGYCNEQDCEWEDWSAWSECSKQCGGGKRSRTGKCPEVTKCPGNGTEEEDCNPDNCQWSDWTEALCLCKKYRSCPEKERCEGNREETIPNCDISKCESGRL